MSRRDLLILYVGLAALLGFTVAVDEGAPAIDVAVTTVAAPIVLPMGVLYEAALWVFER